MEFQNLKNLFYNLVKCLFIKLINDIKNIKEYIFEH
jgi:hypothetical protein